MLEFGKDSKVWVENPAPKQYRDEKEEPYFQAIILNMDETKKEAEVKYLTGGKPNEKVKFEKILSFVNEITVNVNDMAAVEDINELVLLNNMRNRFFVKNIHTNVGPTLIIMNPYQRVEGVYTDVKLDEIIKLHSGGIKFVEERKSIEEPHLYDNTMIAIMRLQELHKNQAIVISGESGAGKTEAAKNSMKCITYYFGKKTKVEKNQISLEDQILGCNPILEAFGNSKTVRNDNSSRFGKYVTINLDITTGIIEGASIKTYLLEKSRVCEPPEKERNYHIFYHIIKGAPPNILEQIQLTNDPMAYKYLAVSKCSDVATINDKELYKITEDAFGVTGFSKDEILTIYKVCAACLLLGNVNFKDLGSDKSGVDDKNGPFEKVCKLLDVDPDIFENALTNNVRIIQGNMIKSPLNVANSISSRNAIAKELYNRLFGWIVKKLNFKLTPTKNSNPNNTKYIGLLDIFGFECFDTINSLEQMCINFTNEKLQDLYINDVFVAEKLEYKKEGLEKEIEHIKFVSNDKIIELMDKHPMGLFQLIDETSMTNSDDKNYLAKITKAHTGHPNFKIPKLSQNKYAISHTAKEVEYTVTGYVAKNADEVKITMVECLNDSKNPYIKYIFMNCLDEEEYKAELKQIEDDKKQQKKPSADKYLGAKFRKEMNSLMKELATCECHYIRCLKPNEEKKKEYFVPTFVFQQIKYLGILDTIRVKKEGYPSRKKFKDFFFRFEEVCFWNGKKSMFEYQKIEDDKVFKELALKCLECMSKTHTYKDILFGINRILMKQAFMSKLERERTIKMKKKEESAILINSIWKMWKIKKKYNKIKKGCLKLQRWFRKEKFKMKIQRMRFRAKTIQAAYKGLIVFRTFKYMRLCVKKIQSFVRMFRMKLKIKKIKKAGRFLNKKLKQYLKIAKMKRKNKMKMIVFNIFEKAWLTIQLKFKSKFAITIQKHVRGFLTKIKHWSKVIRGRDKRMNYLKERSCHIIQRVYRGFRVRYFIKMSNHYANKIQGYWKMIKIYSLILEMRRDCMTIQRCVRIFLGRKNAINSRLKEFFVQEEPNLEKDNLVSNQCLFPNTNYVPTKEDTLTKNEEQHKIGFYTVDPNDDVLKKKKKEFVSVLPDVLQFNEPKIVLFAKILDLDFTIDSSEIYDTLWAGEFDKIYNLNIRNGNPIQQISIGGCHTIVLNNKGKLFSWGWNNYGQCGVSRNSSFNEVIVPKIRRDIKGNIPSIPVLNYVEGGRNINMENQVKQVICGEDHTFIIDQDHNAYACGDNSKGQLGIGHSWDVEHPTLISELKGKVKTIRSTGDINIAISTENDLYLWPYDNPNFKYKPLKFFLSKKVTISSVSCGFNFAVLLSHQGIIYSFGKSNKFGELGTGDLKPRSTPEPLNILIEEGEKITQVSCGYKHTLVKGCNGKVYGWGLNSSGQLGAGNLTDCCSPKLISFDKLYPPPYKVKIFQVASTFRASYFLTETRTVLCCGTGGDFNQIKTPIKYDLKKKTPEIANENCFTPVKIMTSWNKSFSVFYSLLADIRDMVKKVPNRQKVNMILNTLAQKWDFDSTEPPFIESIAGFFPNNFMKKQKQTKVNDKKSTMESKIKNLIKKNIK